jgi:hypothetical protein
MVSDLIGNRTEEAVQEFLNELDNKERLGPKPISGVDFKKNKLSDVLNCSDEIAKRLLTQPSPFLFDDLDQVYIEVEVEGTNSKEIIYLISDSTDPSYDHMCEEIGKNLPEVPYDVECGGYPSRQAEAAALYKISVINSLQEGQYKEEILEILKDYDFSRWMSSDGSYKFIDLLQKIQEEADSVSRVVLMCANIKLIADRVKKDTSYKAYLKEEDAEKLRMLSEEDARINFMFNKKYESASTSKEKILIGEELAEARRKMLSKDYVTNEISILFNIHNLNQNAIPGRAKRIIRNEANIYVSKLSDEGIIKNKELASEFKKKLISRAQRLFLSRMKEIRYKLWSERKSDTDLNSLIPKY